MLQLEPEEYLSLACPRKTVCTCFCCLKVFSILVSFRTSRIKIRSSSSICTHWSWNVFSGIEKAELPATPYQEKKHRWKRWKEESQHWGFYICIALWCSALAPLLSWSIVTPWCVTTCFQASESASRHSPHSLPCYFWNIICLSSICSGVTMINAKGSERAYQWQFYQWEIIHEAFKMGQQEDIKNKTITMKQVKEVGERGESNSRHLLRDKKPCRKGRMKAQISQHSILALHCYTFPWDRSLHSISVGRREHCSRDIGWITVFPPPIR